MTQEEYIIQHGIATDVPGPIMNQNPYSSVDYWYGPYTSVGEACSILQNMRKIGLTVGIYEFEESVLGTYIKNIDGTYTENPSAEGTKYRIKDVVEYQWKTGTADIDLKPKVEKFNLTISPVGITDILADDGDIINFNYNIEGRVSISKGFLYRVYDNTEVFITEFTNIGKGNNTYTLDNPTSSGVYTYRIKVLDSSGAFATTADDKNYVEYTVRYGTITVAYNLSNINIVKIKNKSTLANIQFLGTIQVRDSSFTVNGLYLCNTDESIKIQLTPYNTASGQASETNIGTYYYYLPNESTLAQLNGQECFLLVDYLENETLYKKKQSVFTLLDIYSLAIVSETAVTNYYTGVPSGYTFQLQSGVENISVTLSADEQSDFQFNTTVVQTYRSFTLQVIPGEVQEDAVLKMNYSFIYNNVVTTGTFELVIGDIVAVPEQNYFNPIPPDPRTKLTIVDANIEDYDGIEDGKYYKSIKEPLVSTAVYPSAFILDIYCKINQQKELNKEFITVSYGNTKITYVTEDIIRNVNDNIYTATPLNEWVQIGIGVNIRQDIRGSYCDYHCIYINGSIAKNEQLPSFELQGTEALTVTLGQGLLVQKCFLYYTTGQANPIGALTPSGKSIIYNNYRSHVTTSEPSALPILQLRKITDSTLNTQYFNAINAYKRAQDDTEIKHTTKFGTIGESKASNMNAYDTHYTDPTIETREGEGTLFRQGVDIKKPAQKEYAVLCTGSYIVDNRDLLEGVIIEVHTQGTSTLQYPVPNFKFTFWQYNQEQQLVPYYPPLIKKSEQDYYHECTYTSKCDYMDSSHLNNTPTCIYYNNLIHDLIQSQDITGSPAARNNNLDAIVGFPIIMEVSDETTYINIGSFMLNIDKTGESLGFNVDEGGQPLECLSFEGTSNDASGYAARFILPEGAGLKDYHLYDGTINIDEIESDYALPKTESNPIVKWCTFFSNGLEYRYPDEDIIKTKNGTIKVMSKDDFIRLYTMWSWVAASPNYSKETYKEQFVQHFDLDYCMLYFIQIMVFGQTDNLGKNTMFDTWGNTNIWYPRPYDLDSEAELDNNGKDDVAPFSEIIPELSLDYDDSLTEEEKAAKHLLIDSEIEYNGRSYRRYHYSSQDSNLWINFYKNFKEEIEAFYQKLKRDYNYNADSVITLCKNSVIDVLGVNQFNIDFENKYLGTTDQRLCYGNRWYKYQKWMHRRFAFCDSYFDAVDTATYNISGQMTYTVTVECPQYVKSQYQEVIQNTFTVDNCTFTHGSGGATKFTLKVNQDQVLKNTAFGRVTFGGGTAAYINLLELDVSGNRTLTSLESIVGNNLPVLKKLTIDSSGITSLTNNFIPQSLQTLSAKNVILNTLELPSGCFVETIDLSNSIITGNISFNNLPNLKVLNLTNCVFRGTAVFEDLPDLQNVIFTGASFEKDVTFQGTINVESLDFSYTPVKSIAFAGSNLNIKKLNFASTTFTDTTLNLDAVSTNVEEMYFNNCNTLTHLEVVNGSFQNLEIFNIKESSIKSLGQLNTEFNASPLIFPNISGLKYDDTNSFTFEGTKIESIVNLNWNGSGLSLFKNCTNLTSITGTITVQTSMKQMFYNCRSLESLPSISAITISDGVMNAEAAFAGCHLLDYSTIRGIIRKGSYLKNLTDLFLAKQFPNNQEINISDLLGNSSPAQNNSSAPEVTLSGMFRSYVSPTANPELDRDIHNTIKITGTIPSGVQSTYAMFSSRVGYTNVTVPYNILSNSRVSNIGGMFSSCTVKFTGGPEYSSEGTTITTNNGIQKSFFPTTIVNMNGAFSNTNVVPLNDRIFEDLTALQTCVTTFAHQGSDIKFTATSEEEVSIDVDLNISTIWENNLALTDVSGCFRGVYNVTCGTLSFHSNVDSINISGVLGLTSNSNPNAKSITINISTLSPNNIIAGYRYSYVMIGTRNDVGPFENRTVTLLDTDTSILSKLNDNCNGLFAGASLYIKDAVTTLDLSNATSCISTFSRCKVYSSTTYNPKYVEVILPTSCANYTSMFKSSILLKTLPTIQAPNASILSSMFEGAALESRLNINVDYFDNCRQSLIDISAMFKNNLYIEELTYNSNKGLLEDCVLLQNVKEMFYGAHYLHKGIPKNIFGDTDNEPLTKIASLEKMFYESAILYDVSNVDKCIDSSIFSNLPNLEYINDMFKRVKVMSSSDTSKYSNVLNMQYNGTYIVDPQTFTARKFTDISGLFQNCPINIPFSFKGFTRGEVAFYNTAMNSIGQPFTEESALASITTVRGMFYQMSSREIANVPAFIESIEDYNINKDYIAGRLTNPELVGTPYVDTNNTLDSSNYMGFIIL